MKRLLCVPALASLLCLSPSLAQAQPCKGGGDHTVGTAESLITIAELSIETLPNCTGTNWNTCRDAFLALYEAEDHLTFVFNSNVDEERGCIPCSLAGAIDVAEYLAEVSDELRGLGYGQSIRGDLAFTMRQWQDGYACPPSAPPGDEGVLRLTPAIEGGWQTPDGGTVTVSYDGGRDVYELVLPGGRRSDAVFLDSDALHATGWDAIGYVSSDGEEIRWQNQVWTRGGARVERPPTPDADRPRVEQAGYYVFRTSGSGYRKRFAGRATQIDGYQYYIRKLEAGESTGDLIQTWTREARESSQRACSAQPPMCPCRPSPDIWVSGPTYEVVDFGEDYGALWDRYECAVSDSRRRIPCMEWDARTVSHEEVPCR